MTAYVTSASVAPQLVDDRDLPPPGGQTADVGALHDLKGETRTIARGAHLRLLEESPQYGVLVISGLLFRYAQTRDGSRQVVSLYFPGEWASLEAFLGASIEEEFQAVTRTRVRLFPRGDIRQLLEMNPRLFRMLMIESLFQTGVQSAWLTRNSIMPAVASLAHFLCEVVVRSGAANSDGTVFWPFPFTQQFIAEALGLTPVHVNRMLRELRERGLVEITHGVLRVNNLDDLAAIGEFDPRYLELRSTSRELFSSCLNVRQLNPD